MNSYMLIAPFLNGMLATNFATNEVFKLLFAILELYVHVYICSTKLLKVHFLTHLRIEKLINSFECMKDGRFGFI